jgi:hypothetical protein
MEGGASEKRPSLLAAIVSVAAPCILTSTLHELSILLSHISGVSGNYRAA